MRPASGGRPSAALSAWHFASYVVANRFALDGRTAISYSLVYDGFGKQCTPISILATVRLSGGVLTLLHGGA